MSTKPYITLDNTWYMLVCSQITHNTVFLAHFSFLNV